MISKLLFKLYLEYRTKKMQFYQFLSIVNQLKQNSTFLINNFILTKTFHVIYI